MRYLKGTVEYGLKYDTNQKINLEGYVDSYWEGSVIDRKSTLRSYFSMRSKGEIESPICDPDRDLSKEGFLAYLVRQVV